ncbi:MAG: hypothetical protein GKR91_05415 [Pseudomonadales bacterium]|nr:hypothetical protein [Pseudomonadales bacterium]
MSDENEEISAEEASEALTKVKEMQQAGQERTEIPSWLATLWVVLIFAIFAGIQPEGTNGGLYLLIGIAAYVIVERQQGIARKSTLLTALVIFIITALYLATVYLYRIQGLSFAPYIGGVIGATTYHLIYLASKRKHSTSNDEAA